MFIFRQSAQIQAYIAHLKESGTALGFIPTMGALHDGHMSLVEMAKKSGDKVICSIFVNPTQFDKAEDLEKYPRTETEDILLLEKHGCDIVFIPEVKEVYPEDYSHQPIEIQNPQIKAVLEGEFRPGHFDGMMQVVSRLLEIIPAHRIYMGQKDYQQQMIVREMMSALGIETELIMAPIKREEDGLAMSSRNRRIDPDLRSVATTLYETLKMAKDELQSCPVSEIIHTAEQKITEAGFELEYFRVVDGSDLSPVKNEKDADFIVALVAAWLGEVRLIDNMILKP